MKLLLDQGIPKSTKNLLVEIGIDSIHTSDINLATATDSQIIEFAKGQNRTIVTLDADFHSILARQGLDQPSVIRIRIEYLKSNQMAQLIAELVTKHSPALHRGAAVSVSKLRTAIHYLPIVPRSEIES